MEQRPYAGVHETGEELCARRSCAEDGTNGYRDLRTRRCDKISGLTELDHDGFARGRDQVDSQRSSSQVPNEWRCRRESESYTRSRNRNLARFTMVIDLKNFRTKLSSTKWDAEAVHCSAI